MSGYAANLFGDETTSPVPSRLAKPLTIAELAHTIAAALEESTAAS